jgi:hypothetical protein
MAKRHSQDLRDRVIDAVERGKMSAGRQVVITRSANPWPSSGWSALNAMAPESLSDMAAIAPPSTCRTAPFCRPRKAEKSDITLQALCDRLSAERGVKADTSRREVTKPSPTPAAKSSPNIRPPNAPHTSKTPDTRRPKSRTL